MKDNDLKKVIDAGNFASNNGRVIRNINVLKGKWIRLEVIEETLNELSSDEIQEALQYLQLSEYIDIRDCTSKANVDVSECNYKHTETRLSQKGIKLAKYIINDDAVKV